MMNHFSLVAFTQVRHFDDVMPKQQIQMMNNFSLVASTQIRHFGSVMPNYFSIYKFVFPLVIIAYVTMR